jgi:signal transduction histidine kinase
MKLKIFDRANKTKTEKHKKKLFGIRESMLIGFTVFTVVIVTLIWVFQIALLNTFYGMIKENEIKTKAETVISGLDSADLSEILMQISRDSDFDLLVTDENGSQIASAQSIHSMLFARFTEDNCAAIYTETIQNGGSYFSKYSNPEYTLTENVAGSDNEKTVSVHKEDHDNNEMTSMVYIRTAQTSSGENRLIIIAGTITPVNSTVETLKVQLWCLTAVMIILGFFLAVFISRKISKPIMDINDKAKELANGNYNIVFEEKGSKETVELAKTLNIAEEELSKVDSLRKELIANVSHDLRTPLTMIEGYSEVMRDIPGENTPENVQTIIDETKRLTDLVNDLLDISKLESGKMQIAPKKFNLTESITEILKRYDKLADYRFDFYHGDDVYVWADELKISQVLYNLINNAINYSGEDKVITIRQETEGDKVRISVTDTGEGIPQDKIKDIWERYYKIDREHKRAHIGTGLGLSIVKNILELHGGSYGVFSTEGKGSTFWFSLNILKEDEEQLDKSEPEEPQEKAGDNSLKQEMQNK